MGTPARYYSSTAVSTTLLNSIGSSDTSLQVASSSGFPTSYPFTLILEKDSANEEIVTVTALVGSAYTVTRGVDGTAARSHSAGTSVEHGVSALDFTAFRAHEAAEANVHGIGATAEVVGTTTTQTISNKTLGSNLAAGGHRITGLADPTSAQDAVTRNWAETGMSSQLVQATTQATNAASSASTASTQASNAATSATNAANSASAASTSASNAASSATNASNSASTATTQASNASASAALANDWATKTSSAVAGGEFSAKYHAQQAATSASNASGSASTASTQASNAATSATNASNSASAAATSASNAASSATAASGSASTASTQATNASTSASNAASSASAAASSASAAASSETAAAGSASAASTSASNAASSATAASNSATTATTQATNAANSASAAASSASAAASDASAAAASAAAAASTFDSFDDRYLGAKTADPTVDNDGNALVSGALYFNTVNAVMRVYDTSLGWRNSTDVVGKTFLVVTSSTRPSSPSEPTYIYETDTNLSFVWNGSSWASIGGGATGAGNDKIFWENGQSVTANYTIPSSTNAGTFGPVTVNSGVTVTVSNGANWVVV